ncbi:MAG: hypothetical protein ACREOM_01735 [Candidatus Dormibacteraceae bacterium]
MDRTRLLVVAVVLAVFIAVGGYLIYSNQKAGGRRVTINVTVTGASSMSPSDLSARQDDTVTINVTSDTTGEVHLHGYDIHFNAVAGQTVSHTFKAVNTGDFDIEWESTSKALGHLVVT